MNSVLIRIYIPPVICYKWLFLFNCLRIHWTFLTNSILHYLLPAIAQISTANLIIILISLRPCKLWAILAKAILQSDLCIGTVLRYAILRIRRCLRGWTAVYAFSVTGYYLEFGACWLETAAFVAYLVIGAVLAFQTVFCDSLVRLALLLFAYGVVSGVLGVITWA